MKKYKKMINLLKIKFNLPNNYNNSQNNKPVLKPNKIKFLAQ